MVLYYLLLAPCLSLWNYSTFYWPTDYPYCTQLSSTGPLPITMVLYYLLLAPCLSLWYSTIFYWLPSYPWGILSSSVSLPIPMLLYYLPNDHAYPYGSLLSSTGPMPIPGYTPLNIHEIWLRLLLGEHLLYIRAKMTSFVNSLD